jgi:hypothetical protein
MMDIAVGSAKLKLAQTVLFVIASAFGVLVGGAILYLMLFDREPPITYGAFSVADVTGRETTKFRAGDIIVLTREFCSVRDKTVVIDRRFIALGGKTDYPIPSSGVILPDGCVSSARAVPIPPYLPPGKYRFEAVVSYTNNLFFSGIVRAPSPILEIVR